MNEETFKKVLKISEDFFGTQSDPDQMPINQESADKLNSISSDTILYKFDDKGNPIAWSVVVPTTIEVMNKFLHKDISEKELLQRASKDKKFEALYLCAVFVLPEYRRKGLAKDLLIESVKKLSNQKELPLYSWIYSEEGKKLSGYLSSALGVEILKRE